MALILDNGAYTVKVGMSKIVEPRLIPNCVMKAKSERRRLFIGDQLKDCRDISGLYYILSHQKGYLVNWDIQKTIWDYIFSEECCPVNFAEIPLILTEPIFNFPPIQEGITEIFFEEYDCNALFKANATDLAAYKYRREHNNPLCCIVIDMGYSFTHIVPYVKEKKCLAGIRRIDVGGKLLTNRLKEIISYRQLNVMDETYVVNQVKEDTCFVSEDLMEDMALAKKPIPSNTIAKDYILPDYTTLRRGYLEEPGKAKHSEHQILRLNNERFTIPEILFHPSDVGIQQMGIAEAVMDSIQACPQETHSHLFANIVCIGGCSLFPGMKSRLFSEIRSYAPDDFKVNLVLPDNPVGYAWQGGVLCSQDPEFAELCITREDYEEQGASVGADRDPSND